MGVSGSIPGLGRSPGEGIETHSSTLAWKIPWTEEPGRLQSRGVAKSQTWLKDFTFTSIAFKNCEFKLCIIHGLEMPREETEKEKKKN